MPSSGLHLPVGHGCPEYRHNPRTTTGRSRGTCNRLFSSDLYAEAGTGQSASCHTGILLDVSEVDPPNPNGLPKDLARDLKVNPDYYCTCLRCLLRLMYSSTYSIDAINETWIQCLPRSTRDRRHNVVRKNIRLYDTIMLPMRCCNAKKMQMCTAKR